MTPELHSLVVALAYGTVALNVLAIGLFILLFLSKTRWSKARARIAEQGERGLFLLVLLAAAGALLIEIMGLPPCMWCWWQRVFLYPQAVILAVALINKQDVTDILLTLSGIGALIALYQHYLQFGGSALVPCGATGPDCAIRSVFEFGFVTLPWMAFSVFIVSILVMVHIKLARRNPAT